MEKDLDELEKIALENINLAEIEKEVALKFNKTVSLEYKRAKNRKNFVISAIGLNKNRKSLAKKFKNIINRKREISIEGILEFTKRDLEIEENFAIYYDLLADVQIQISEIQNKIADLEIEIAKDRLKIAYETNYAAQERNKLGKKQLAFINAVKENKSLKKQNKLRDDYLSLHETLIKDRKDITNDMKLLENLENLLADLNKELSIKLSEREKVRPN